MADGAALAGMAAIVTGGAQGIGRATALELARQGASVLVADVDATGGDRTAAEIVACGGQALAVTTDVADRAQVERMAQAAVDHWGGIDVLVTAAAVYPRAAFLDLDDATWQRVINVNLYGTFVCAQVVARHMVARGRGGRIVAFASNSGVPPARRGAHYLASKGGNHHLTHAMALELAPHGILVNAVSPGVTDTAQPRQGMSEAELYSRAERVPLKRIAQPDDIAPVIAFLCSEPARYLTGQTIAVNGGTNMS